VVPREMEIEGIRLLLSLGDTRLDERKFNLV
jgi:hypothetical protein